MLLEKVLEVLSEVGFSHRVVAVHLAPADDVFRNKRLAQLRNVRNADLTPIILDGSLARFLALSQTTFTIVKGFHECADEHRALARHSLNFGKFHVHTHYCITMNDTGK